MSGKLSHFVTKNSSKTTLQVWLQVTTTRRARTPSTRTTRARSPTQITELLLPADSSPSSSIQCPLDTQANECVDVSEFYLSLLDWFYIYMAFHVVSIVYTLSWCKSAQLCVRYGCENICTFVHSLSLNAKRSWRIPKTSLLMTLTSQPHPPTKLFLLQLTKEISPKNASSRLPPPLLIIRSSCDEPKFEEPPKASTPKNL